MESEQYIGVVKEPRGFLKFIQLFFAILAFATTSGYSGTASFKVNCPNATNKVVTQTYSFSYPFRISSDISFPKYFCNNSKEHVYPFGDYAAPSQFFVFVGVMAFLYCLAALILYIFFNNVYSTNPSATKSDLIITIGFALFWFIAAVAWADGVTKLKYYTNPQRIIYENKDCDEKLFPNKCHPDFSATYAGLDISLICGFTNVGLWAACVWFIWKECPWYGRQDNISGSAGGAEGGASPYAANAMPGGSEGVSDDRY